MRRTRMASFALCLGVLAGCQATPDDDAAHEVASAAVLVAPPQKGVMPRTVVAWGEVSQGAPYQHMITLPFDGSLATLKVAQGEAVHRGQVLASFDLAPDARATMDMARTGVQSAAASLAHVRRLRNDALATDEQVVQASKALADAQAAFAVFAQAGSADSSVALRAPVDGTVATVAVSPGQVVAANTPLLAISPTASLTVAAGVEPGAAGMVRAGMPVDLELVGGTRRMSGHVLGIAGAIDAQTRLVPVRIRPDASPMPGSTWRAEITVGEAAGWTAPADAVVDDSRGRCVYQVRDGKAHRVDVRVVLERGDRVLLSGDIDPSVPLVTAGGPQLAEGMTVVTSGGGR
ncbi:efflux RND transporter periplasmic adaptor subunit [Luteibacter aegosomatissinici]|uniref:efflux RND transporter periplasmic adaptor subunit n=1 Tax=Luteibacter aegosomatissinici TaxID=2911539 RepID=UPI001FF7C0D3|nr:efflux RND transporter periplasmic adaptor subunit [Luteibacter aegosomatissinici]UPG96290.1 efflux RND transporter periplasmic adaptor subunit [Luteibacter aegosomatissinici]